MPKTAFPSDIQTLRKRARLQSIVIAYTLNPLVAWLEAIRSPRAAGTVGVMARVIAGAAL